MDAIVQSRDPASVLPIEANGLRVMRDGRALLDGVDITVTGAQGIVAIVGPNGAGKSLLLRAMAGLVQPDAGQVQWAGKLPDAARIARLGFVLQRPVLLRRTARANLEFALRIAGCARVERSDRALDALNRAGLAHAANAPAHALSGGEQQRLALTRAMLLKPECLFLDEPTANLDPSSVHAFERQLARARDQGMPMLMVSQDLVQVRRIADRVIFMAKGRILEQASADRFFTARQSPEAQSFFNGEFVL